MKFILKNQIDGFSQKSKDEKKRLIKLAQKDNKNQIALVSFLIGLICGVRPGAEYLVLKFLGRESFWIELCFVIPFAWFFGFIVSGLIINPKIEQIIKEEMPNKSSDPT